LLKRLRGLLKSIIKEAKQRREIFNNLPEHLKEIKKFLKSLDEDCRVFLFGSVARGEHTFVSDIDVLILTKLKPNFVISELRKKGFREPFEYCSKFLEIHLIHQTRKLRKTQELYHL
jgi:predicted nucleotidyltransferase